MHKQTQNKIKVRDRRAFSVRLPDDLLEKIENEAEKNLRSMNAQIEVSLREILK